MAATHEKYDAWLTGNEGPAAIVLREHLMPVEGHDGVIFPPTFAAGDGFKGGYNIDVFGNPDEGQNVCLIDSVGSQANRIEPIFMESAYCALVPQIDIAAGERKINLLHIGHRAGDALARCSELQDELKNAFKQLLLGDGTPLAKLAPTSFVFGVWDSRDTSAKLPRLVSSSIRAFNVRELTRGAVYTPPVNYSDLDVFTEEEKEKAEGDKKSPLAKRGFVHIPASNEHGGVIATGGIRRDATLSLAALQQIRAKAPQVEDANKGKQTVADLEATLRLRRYILGLSLVAITAPPYCYIRQGCNLVVDPDTGTTLETVLRTGKRADITLTHTEALEYAKTVATEFGCGESKSVSFVTQKAKDDVAGKTTSDSGGDYASTVKKMKKTELVEECKKKELPTDGKVSELKERLIESYKATDNAGTESETES